MPGVVQEFDRQDARLRSRGNRGAPDGPTCSSARTATGVVDISAHDRFDSAGGAHLATVKIDRLIGHAAHRVQIVGYENDRPSFLPKLIEPLKTATLEGDVAHSQNLVHEENLSIHVRRHREPQPYVHAG
ncbi:MAG: hypothetical protein H6Q85_3007 [candidate division NC10 bacterium]|nr:hypothetical protein [candidate division NC10 bacterium]